MTAAQDSLHFGHFELRPRERRLIVQGRPAQLGARAFDLLHALAAQPDRLMSKSELLDTVWPGVVVEESNLHVQVSALRKLLGNDVIATVPGRGYRMTSARVAAAPPAVAAPAAAAHVPVNAAAAGADPPLPRPLVGRADDLNAVMATLQRSRCVSLVGPGGVGKTSLARAAVQRATAQQALRCLWVDLAALTDTTALPGAVARAAGQALGEGEPLRQLAPMLGGAALLLVLDNAEHLIDAVAMLVAELLTLLPQLRVLVTSQIVLQGAREAVVRLDPLPLAQADGAQALLAQRIAAADRRVVLDATAQPLLDAICRQLDGLPLALEMAAARVPLLGLKRVHDELAHRFALLTAGRREAAPRHRTLHAALDWSYGLLGTEEQRLFRALGVWAGGFTLDLAVAQMTDVSHEDRAARWDVIDHLAALVDRSLVVASADDPPRYRLLETMRAYALEQLAAHGEEDAVRRRQAHGLIALMQFGEEEAAPGTPQRCAEIENVGAALPWLQQHDFAAAVALCVWCAAHDTFTRWSGQTSRWMAPMEPRLAGPEGQALAPALRVDWWNAFARTLVMRRHARAVSVARHACALARAGGDAIQLHQALVVLARSTESADEETAATAAELRALTAANPQWAPRRRLLAVGTLAHVASQLPDGLEGLLAARQEELAMALELGMPHHADMVRTNLMAALNQLRRYDEAARLGTELLPRLEQQRSANLPWAYGQFVRALVALDRHDVIDELMPRAWANARDTGVYSVLEALAARVGRSGRLHHGARLLGVVEGARTRGDDRLFESGEIRRLLAWLQQNLDAATLQRLQAEGAALDDAGFLALVRG